jgi:hypothetical protein
MSDPTLTFAIFGVIWAVVFLRAARKSGYEAAQRKYAPKPPAAKFEVYKAPRRRLGSSSRRRTRPTAPRP